MITEKRNRATLDEKGLILMDFAVKICRTVITTLLAYLVVLLVTRLVIFNTPFTMIVLITAGLIILWLTAFAIVTATLVFIFTLIGYKKYL